MKITKELGLSLLVEAIIKNPLRLPNGKLLSNKANGLVFIYSCYVFDQVESICDAIKRRLIEKKIEIEYLLAGKDITSIDTCKDE